MSERTRIDLGILGPGYFLLPRGIVLCCPECGKKVRDHGNLACQMDSSQEGGGFKLVIRECVCGMVNIEPISQ